MTELMAGLTVDPTDPCLCFAFDADSDEEGWRPCPPHLCELEHHHHLPDWLVVFARKVGLEDERCEREPGHRFYVMLDKKEAHGLLGAIWQEVNGAGTREETP